jgi:hypothetical protein
MSLVCACEALPAGSLGILRDSLTELIILSGTGRNEMCISEDILHVTVSCWVQP